MTLSNEKIVIIAAVVVITALSLYTAILRGSLRSTTDRADENLRRAEVCEDALTLARRSHTAALEAQADANAIRQEIDAQRANLAREIGAIVDSGRLDDRVCQLARAAYQSAMCAGTDGRAVPSSTRTDSP